ncbi:MAG: PTS ascorbate transporter subunit IIC [Erysipelotrichaceae bacterium]|nr:PTS ascorbate transporter subunit IIC [Erysipelotrichaceae bacterium]
MTKKQIPLRLSEQLYDAIAAWAEDDFRSVNGQIEYLLTECVRQRRRNGKYVSEHLDEPLDIRIPEKKPSDWSKSN